MKINYKVLDVEDLGRHLGSEIELRRNQLYGSSFGTLSGFDTDKGFILFKDKEGSELEVTINDEITAMVIPGKKSNFVLNSESFKKDLKNNYGFFVGQDVTMTLGDEVLNGYIIDMNKKSGEYLAQMEGDLVPQVYKFSEINSIQKKDSKILYERK